jgi:hypothetical protein
MIVEIGGDYLALFPSLKELVDSILRIDALPTAIADETDIFLGTTLRDTLSTVLRLGPLPREDADCVLIFLKSTVRLLPWAFARDNLIMCQDLLQIFDAPSNGRNTIPPAMQLEISSSLHDSPNFSSVFDRLQQPGLQMAPFQVFFTIFNRICSESALFAVPLFLSFLETTDYSSFDAVIHSYSTRSAISFPSCRR